MINTSREWPLMRNTTMSTLTIADSMRRTRIKAAIFIGVVLGCIFAFCFPHGLLVSIPSISPSRIVARSDSQVASGKCETSKKMNFIKAEFALASEMNAALKKQIKDLTESLQLIEQKKHQIPKQVFVLDEQPKAGPFGTVKGLRTNPAISPDESINPRLAEILNKVAMHQELIITLANSNDKHMLEFWFTNIKRVNIPNYLVVALDEEIAQFCQVNNVPVYKRSDPNQNIDFLGKTGGNHAISGLKFRVLREFLQLGYSILLSDIDILFLQNPFMYLHRDSDIESMTDGHDNMTAYGFDYVFDEPSMGWARYAHTIRMWVYNSGFFYIRPTFPSIELLDRVSLRLSQEPNTWDQAVFNEELFYPSYPGYNGLYASRRTMDFLLFMNSKVLFKTVRKNSRLRMHKPVIIHVNYHPDKLARLKGIEQYYVYGKDDALDQFPDGSE